jgi:hypothetical protein
VHFHILRQAHAQNSFLSDPGNVWAIRQIKNGRAGAASLPNIAETKLINLV